jgi:hypothetical protein
MNYYTQGMHQTLIYFIPKDPKKANLSPSRSQISQVPL